ncbi:hypothetical protein Llala01_00001 [Lactococcus lactis subsp. lactis]|uniref:hypothetical protein n=1 Tax=Lactococcus lactis TaxID=1358 RepID=UPI001058E2D7|nr:hypothetical protein [Lactococcus lactis]MDX6024478.1 hypothetical protein [Lactococcus lactis subsp. lactis]QPT52769.1 hypothetical protein I6G22_11525 [Lactococcus lactis]TDG83582.1 hypothetical protein C5L15_001767 [Lactococcus lactis subsp. lactis]
MSDLPKMLSKREIELEELEEAKYVQSLRDNIEKLQEQLNTAKKALTEIDRSRRGMQFRRDRNPDVARQALREIGGTDE